MVLLNLGTSVSPADAMFVLCYQRSGALLCLPGGLAASKPPMGGLLTGIGVPLATGLVATVGNLVNNTVVRVDVRLCGSNCLVSSSSRLRTATPFWLGAHLEGDSLSPILSFTLRMVSFNDDGVI